MRQIFLAVLLWAPLLGQQSTPPPLGYSALMELPTSRAKDYAIERYMQMQADAEEARALFFRVRTPKSSHLLALAEKSSDPTFAAMLSCRNSATKDLLSASPACLAISLSPARAAHLAPDERLKLADRVRPIDPIKAVIFEAMASDRPLQAALKEPDAFFAIALQAPIDYLKAQIDWPLSREQLAPLAADPRMGRLLERSFVYDYPGQLRRSLLLIDPHRLSHFGALYLGLLALDAGEQVLAIAAFRTAESKAWSRYGKDRALFWLWKSSKEPAHLEALSESYDINLYALYAKEQLDKPWPEVITRVPARQQARVGYTEKRLYDPFFWAHLQGVIHRRDHEGMERALMQLGHKRAEPYRAAIERRMGSGKEHFFLNPWPDLIADLSQSDRALLLGLMRQESHFIPAAISTSYAIGSMQFMPFLIEHMDKERGKNPNAWAQFNPENQMVYAKAHLKWLQARLAHPLYIAYAYNGGIGFTKRMLEGEIFKKGPHEPFISLERVPIQEPREYGKIVLANYAVYRQLFDERVTIDRLLEMLVPPSDLYPDR